VSRAKARWGEELVLCIKKVPTERKGQKYGVRHRNTYGARGEEKGRKGGAEGCSSRGTDQRVTHAAYYDAVKDGGVVTLEEGGLNNDVSSYQKGDDRMKRRGAGVVGKGHDLSTPKKMKIH